MVSTTNIKLSKDSEEKDKIIKPTVTSAPSTCKTRTVTNEIQQTVIDCFKRSSSCVESKYRCTITSERLAQLKKIVENAIRDHRIFSIKGGWNIIRRELLRRHWIEKYESTKSKTSTFSGQQNGNSVTEELTLNLPVKQDWESPAAYTEKCEKMVMSRMLQNFDTDFYWSMRKDQVDLQHRTSSYKLINRFSRSLFASKEGLTLLLQQSHWFTEAGVAHINYPRCYVLGFPEHFNFFVDDFRLTACMGMLKWFRERYEQEDKYAIQSPEGKIPYKSLSFAMDRCVEHVTALKHLDIDKEETHVWDYEWEQFFTHYYSIVHENAFFLETKSVCIRTMYNNIDNILAEIKKLCPETEIDGMRNIWILKPGNKCRGRGIQLVKDITEVEKIMNLKLKYVVQKYIEKPLQVYNTKFDIRQWFIVTSAQPLTIWMYRDCYLRFSSQTFSLENFHESLHLTNHAVQCKYTNTQDRDKALPIDNMWDSLTFKKYLEDKGYGNKWDEIVYPGMKQSIICAMLCSQDTMDRRQNTFELYGADFMLSEDLKPWLLEINCSPDMSHSTSVTARMCPQVLEDVIKVVVDKRRDTRACTGLFDQIYKQNMPRSPPYLGMNLAVRGRRLFKRNKKQKEKIQIEPEHDENSNKLFFSGDNIKPENTTTKYKRMPTRECERISALDMYNGPIIQDLIEDLHQICNTQNPDECGVDFVPAVKLAPLKKRTGTKNERVSKQDTNLNKNKTHNSFNRKQNERESKKHAEPLTPNNKLHVTINTKLELFDDWALKNKQPGEDLSKSGQSNNNNNNFNIWNKDSDDLIKGKTVFDRLSLGTKPNKSYVKSLLSTLNLNQELPLITANLNFNNTANVHLPLKVNLKKGKNTFGNPAVLPYKF